MQEGGMLSLYCGFRKAQKQEKKFDLCSKPEKAEKKAHVFGGFRKPPKT